MRAPVQLCMHAHVRGSDDTEARVALQKYEPHRADCPRVRVYSPVNRADGGTRRPWRMRSVVSALQKKKKKAASSDL